MSARTKQNQGMNWIRPEKRLALYLRDGLACAYCGETVEDGAKLTLDHLTPHSLGGKNQESNLVTACHRCNSGRGSRDWREFAGAVAGYVDHDVKAEEVIAHIERTIQRPLDIAEAKAIMERRGGFSAALQSIRSEAK